MNLKSKFIHLHNHTEYSLLDGACKIDSFLNTASQFGMDAIAITDHGNLFGSIEFYKKALKMGIKPIIGIEIYITENIKKTKNSVTNHLLLLAKNKKGYKNLVKLSSFAYLDGFYKRPRIDKNLLKQYSEGLIGASACLAGEIPRLILQNKIEEAKKTALEYQEILGKGNFYLELMNHNLKEQQIVNKALISISKELNIPLIATNDIHFLKKEHKEVHDILLCIQTKTTLQDTKRFKFESDEVYFKSQQQMIELFKDTPEAIENTIKIAEECNVDITFGEYLFPAFKIPDKYKNDQEYLEHLVYEGMKKRYKNITDEIKNRVNMELKVIEKMGFAGYFLIVSDFVNYAKQNGIPVGPGRGSAAGSIVSYCTGITDIDPLKYNLLFERFLNPERISMPDIDIDFSDEKREKVIDYVREKYGDKNVSQIITFGRMKAKSVVRDVGRVMGLEYSFVDKIAKMIPENKLQDAIENSPELAEKYKNDPTINKLLNYAMELEGLPRQPGMHAAGVVIAPDDLTNYVALYKGKEGITTQVDKDLLEELGLLKMDFLGLRTLTVIDHTLELIKKNHGKSIDLSNIPLDDPDVFQLLSEGKTIGIFQFESEGMQSYLKKLKPSSIEDMIAMNALYRPGPLKSNMVDEFIHRKHGIKKIEYLHPLLEPILKDTYGVIVYQEQVMQIASKLANFTMGEADTLRKAMGKKKPEILAKFEPKFIEGAKQNGMEEKKAKELYELMKQFGEYGFNKSHSACYAYVAYQTAYLKAHYPTEFMAALLSSVINDSDKIVKFIDECKKLNIEIVPPDINESDFLFTVKNNKIYFALGGIKSCGQSSIDDIIKIRTEDGPFESFFDFIKRTYSYQGIKKNTIEALIYAGTFDKFGNRAQLINSINDALETAKKAITIEANNQTSLFGDSLFGENSINEDINFQLPQIEEFPLIEKLNKEKEFVGIYLSGHPLDKFKEIMKFLMPIEKLKEFSQKNEKLTENNTYIIGGFIKSKQIKRTKNNNSEFAILTIEDYTSDIELPIFQLDKYESILKEQNTIVLFLRSYIKEDSPKFIVDNIVQIQDVFTKNNLSILLEINPTGIEKKDIDNIFDRIFTKKGKGKVYLSFFIPDLNKRFVYTSKKKTTVVNKELIKFLNEQPIFDSIFLTYN